MKTLSNIQVSLILASCICFLGLTCQEQPKLTNSLNDVVIATDLGDITIRIDEEAAPVTAANFLRYVDESRWDSASFYRTVTMENQPDNDILIEVIQGGLSGFGSKRLAAIPHETTEMSGLKHVDGTISMARSEPGTASSEFFICIGDQPSLDFGGMRNPDGQGFAAFGQVIDGMDVVRVIQTTSHDGQRLTPPVGIKSINRIK